MITLIISPGFHETAPSIDDFLNPIFYITDCVFRAPLLAVEITDKPARLLYRILISQMINSSLIVGGDYNGFIGGA